MNGERYHTVRDYTEALAAPLSPEDQTVQSMPDVSPTKWHRAHTTWFFETFVLKPFAPGYTEFDPHYGFLFNSYYEAVGARHARPERGLLSRPGVAEIAEYRRHVDKEMADFFMCGVPRELAPLVELGLHHEQQHQELLLMDIEHVLSQNPLWPAYSPDAPIAAPTSPDGGRWIALAGGTVAVGHDGDGFHFDNEAPRHEVLLRPFSVRQGLVTNGEWLAFMADAGYERPELWMSDGWAAANSNGWRAPAYWHQTGRDEWSRFTLRGMAPVDPAAPVVHVSWYEADAFARWQGARLPSEFEWETAAPVPEDDDGQWYGAVWQWTESAYRPYPGFAPAPGAVGEYNGKFMVNQHVLRGSAAITSPGHARRTYRNFFPPGARWAHSGVRLARDDG